MEDILLPTKFELQSVGENQAIITLEPCFPGYGTTIGNALRRILLSSLPGTAVTAIKIRGATHEFTTVPHVKEDVVDIILNVKQLRFKLHGVEQAQVHLKAKGEKNITGKDIKLTSEVEIVNPEAPIAVLTDKTAELSMELFLEYGRGYRPVESMERGQLELGTIGIDAIFTPVRNVNYEVENVRVGKMTNYDRLKMNLTTDGSIAPAEAIRIAAGLLVEQFRFIAEQKTEQKEKEGKKAEEKPKKKETKEKKSQEKDETPKK